MLLINREWKFVDVAPPTTAYTTTWNCLNGHYPVEQSIRSFLWCDKIVVVDGGSNDGTRELLTKLQEEIGPKLEIYDIPIDLDNPGKDGFQKAMAFAMCGTEYAIQFDIDEICQGSIKKWKTLLKDFPEDIDILNLPVLEPYGKFGNVRLNKEHNPVKWRIFRVKPEITHGIPLQDRIEVDGKVYSKGGSDGCFPCHIVSNQMYPSKPNKTALRMAELKYSGDKTEYKKFLEEMVLTDEPRILHLGHVNLKQKIKHYLTSWHKWWCELYNRDPLDPKNNLFFPGNKVEDVTEEMIDKKVKELIKTTPVLEYDEVNTRQG